MQPAIALVIVLVLLLAYFAWADRGKKERLWGAVPELAAEEQAFSPYGNMSLRDADMLANERVFPEFVARPSDPLDNSDVVRSALEVPSQVFQPNQLGVTPTTFGGLASFQMAEPGRSVSYELPQTGMLDADEVLARKQQHIGSMNKRAIDGAVRSTANVFRKYFQNELAEAEGTDWWGAEASTLDTDFDPSS